MVKTKSPKFKKLSQIGSELKHHAPFTIAGAMAGIVFMLFFTHTDRSFGPVLFAVFHPAHVFLSALVTASMFKIHTAKKHFISILLIGYFGSIGIATLSDSVMPFLGEKIFGLSIPTHTHSQHQDSAAAEPGSHDTEQANSPRLHLGFLQEWYIVNPAALLGIIVAYFKPRTKEPHALHVLISTWASSSHILMNLAGAMTAAVAASIFLILFLSVWLPCCISDIVFPVIFTPADIKPLPCSASRRHSDHSSSNQP